MIDRRKFIQQSALIGSAIGLSAQNVFAYHEDEIKIGLIGLDSSHCTAYSKLINDAGNPKMKGARVAFAYPHGSSKIESSRIRIPEITKEVEAMGIQIVDSLDALIKKSDAIMLMTNDGTMHLEQILPVLKAKKPVFVNKPVAANLADVIKIYNAARAYGVPIFSSSSLRYLEGAQKVRYQNAVGKVTGAEAYSPQKTEPSHTDLFWYGIHGVEILFTMMGTGCESVKRITGAEQDVIIGKWSEGRIGTYKGDVHGRQFYGGTAFGTDGVLPVGPFAGYAGLAEVIVQFFGDKKSPVEEKETIEIYAFMEAADESKRQNGEWVDLKGL